MRYSFDVKSHGKSVEVGVDAVSGQVLENGPESLAKEAKEAVQKVLPAKHETDGGAIDPSEIEPDPPSQGANLNVVVAGLASGCGLHCAAVSAQTIADRRVA